MTKTPANPDRKKPGPKPLPKSRKRTTLNVGVAQATKREIHRRARVAGIPAGRLLDQTFAPEPSTQQSTSLE